MDEQRSFIEGDDAEVIDISPLTCPGCRKTVDLEDAFCQSCGASLLEVKPQLCGNCGHAMKAEARFCPGCGTQSDVEGIVSAPSYPDESQTVEQETSLADTAITRTLRGPVSADVVPQKTGRRKTFALVAALVFLVGAASAGWYFFLKPPDLSVYDAEMAKAAAVAEDLENSLQALDDPGDLPGFAAAVERREEEVSGIAEGAQALEDQEHRSILLEVVDAEKALLAEMSRLATLPSASIEASEFSSLPDLVDELEVAYAAAHRTRSVASTPEQIEVSHTIIERTLYDLSEYRKEVIAERARITRANKARARELADTKAFIGEFDGIVGRYADSRTELSDWIEETNAGSTWYEAYQTLDQQQARRTELRDELAALEAPAEFTTAKSELLGIMDTAIDAMGAASRGMAEFQYDWSYWDFRDTPGWQQFESQTSDITSRLTATLSDYESTKERLIKRLSKKTPLPDLPA